MLLRGVLDELEGVPDFSGKIRRGPAMDGQSAALLRSVRVDRLRSVTPPIPRHEIGLRGIQRSLWGMIGADQDPVIDANSPDISIQYAVV